MPTISIIVPVYNVEKYIHKCIDSIINQTFINFELILVDDGSTDKCGEICDDYAKKDSRIKVIHKENGGLSSARNKGIEVSKGEFIAFVDSDDYIDSRMYEIMLNKAIEHKSDIVICDFKSVDEESIEDYKYNKIIKYIEIENLTNLQALERLYGYNSIVFEVAWNKLYRKKLFNKLRYEEGRIYEDSIIVPNLFYICNKVTYIHNYLYSYLKREGSITSSPFTLKSLDRVYMLKSRMDFFKKHGLIDLMFKAEYIYRTKFIEDYFKAQDYIPNIEKVLKELKLDFNKGIIDLLKNTNFYWKEKLMIYIFILNPYLYKLYESIKCN